MYVVAVSKKRLVFQLRLVQKIMQHNIGLMLYNKTTKEKTMEHKKRQRTYLIIPSSKDFKKMKTYVDQFRQNSDR